MHVTLHLSSEPVENALYPNAMRFSVKEILDGQSNPRSEGLDWQISDSGIVIVEADGTVQAVATGSVQLTVRLRAHAGLMATASVTVKEGGRADVELE